MNEPSTTGPKIQTFVILPVNLEKYKVLESAGLFNLDSGRIEVNINNGQIQSVHIYKMTYKRNNQ